MVPQFNFFRWDTNIETVQEAGEAVFPTEKYDDLVVIAVVNFHVALSNTTLIVPVYIDVVITNCYHRRVER